MAYINELLIFSNGSRADISEKVKLVIKWPIEAVIQIDIKRCGFEAPCITYLEFIVEAGKGLQIDPGKIQVALEC